MATNKIILASASPQRKEILKDLGLSFTVIPSHVDESLCNEEDPAKKAVQLAQLKAEAVSKNEPNTFVIGCDTLVVSSDGSVFEKPIDSSDAVRMLTALSGSTCTVHSGLCVISPDGSLVADVSSSLVHFKQLSEQEIDWWISTNLWKDRSGSFQIDGPGQLLIEKIEGDFTGVVGLPVGLFGLLMKQAGWDLLIARSA